MNLMQNTTTKPLTPLTPLTPLSPLLAMQRDAQSGNPDVGIPAMTSFLQCWRPRVARSVAVLHRGLRRPRLTREEFVEQTLVVVAAELHECTARSDSALHAWVSARTTQAVLEMQFDARRLERVDQRAPDDCEAGRAA